MAGHFKPGRGMSTSTSTTTGSVASATSSVGGFNTGISGPVPASFDAIIGSATDIDLKVKLGIGRVSDNMHIAANEPSLALYCLQEHVRKEVPNMITQRNEFSRQHRLLQGTSYDCDYSIGAVKSIERSREQFESIQNQLAHALFLKEQLKYEFGDNRRKINEKKWKI